jgi:hypothetical protein
VSEPSRGIAYSRSDWSPAASLMITSRQCDAEYAANKAAIKASGQTKRAFIAACRHGQ